MASANVFASLMQPVKSVQDYDDERSAREINRLSLQDKRRAGALADQTFQQQIGDRNALQQFAQQSGGDQNKLMQLLRSSGSAGLMSQADALEKSMLGRRETESKIAGQDATTAKTSFATGEDKRKAAIQQIASLNSPEEAVGLLNQQVSQGAISMQAAQALERMVKSDPKWQLRLVMGINDPKEMLAALQPHMVAAGGAMVNTNPLAGPTGQGAANAIPITQTADNAATQATSRANNQATVSASLENAGAMRDQAQATRDAASIQTGFKNEQDLRKEFEGLPEVKNYKQAYPAFAAVKDAAARNTPQSDINLVYGIAKLYDPNSVVREGEYATVANSPSIPERVKGYAQYIAGGGKLSPETKKQILAEAQGRLGTYEAEAKKARGSYEGIAKQRGMNAKSVFADMGDMGDGAKPAAGGVPSMSDIDAELARRRAKAGK